MIYYVPYLFGNIFFSIGHKKIVQVGLWLCGSDSYQKEIFKDLQHW